jgi:putative acetyltransferase
LLSLETGSQAGFEPARKLYERFGFEYCGSFGSYKADPNSAFMQLRLSGAAGLEQ